ncbi:MAG: hypothetical protein HKN07_15190 [Acidimicrobiia bacterium]|nr:hypothetical protein [Acidimicrobiia bacterium]
MNIPIRRIARWGLLQLFGSTRRQQPGMAAFGAALAVYGWYRDRSKPDRQLLHRQTLVPGEEVKIVLKKDTRTFRRRR